jgi:A/G-specific adenine glycosylase
MINDTDASVFRQKVMHFYMENRRSMPWRDLPEDNVERFYRVLVSEMMLQQTQVSRVLPKYIEWMNSLSTLKDAQSASLHQILLLWSGLGYNRRGKYVYDILQELKARRLPASIEELTCFKGIGHNTAAAILVYTYDQPHVFVETNIRTVMIAEFYGFLDKVSDRQILECVKETLPKSGYRDWYYALMDYGTHLKKLGYTARASSQYKKQSRFEGSTRQLLAGILREVITSKQGITWHDLLVQFSDNRTEQMIKNLVEDGLLELDDDKVVAPK